MFYLLANRSKTAYFKFSRLRTFERRTACPIAAKKSGSSHSIQVSLTPAVHCIAGFYTCAKRHLAEKKSLVLTAQATQPALKNWPRAELWRFHAIRFQVPLREAHYAVTPLWEPTNIATQRRKERNRNQKRKTAPKGRDFI